MWRFGANKACCLPAFLHLPAALHLLDTDPLEGWGFVDDGIPSLLCKHSHGENSQTKEERVPRNSCCLHTFFLLDQALLQEFFEITQVVYLRIIVLGWIWSLESEKLYQWTSAVRTVLVRGFWALQSEMKELKRESTWYLEMIITGAVGMVKGMQ